MSGANLATGSRLGPYEIIELLGAGGMGEVYRGRDTRLGRDIAIKVLPTDVAQDADRRARFEREARAVAALDHPHICGIYDVGSAGATPYLVMPLLEGDTLAARLARGALAPDDALRIAAEIAGALDKAHRHGIVHRDLKPANVMLTKTGVKLLDFGLAKLRGTPRPVALGGDAQSAPTAVTAEGTILGTIHYMAPEQVEGKEADHRADIWALGAVLYEMIAGARPFQGDTAAGVMGAILKDSPPQLSDGKAGTLASLDTIVTKCMAKDPERRWQSAADLRELLLLASESSSQAEAAVAAGSKNRWSVAVGALTVASALGAVVGILAWGARGTEPEATLQLSVLPPADAVFSSPPSSVVAPQIAVSPDGTRLAFVAQSAGAPPMLWVRALDADKAEMLRGTEDATYPFWAPDSRALGFFSRGRLKTIDLTGSPPRTLADAGLDTRGGAWGQGDVILFAPANGPLSRVSANGGLVTPATRMDEARGETSHRFPTFFPDGGHFLFATRTRDSTEDNVGLSVGSLDALHAKPVIARTAWGGQFVASGHILYLRAGTLLAHPFDRTRLETTGEPVALAENVGATTVGFPSFSASTNGILAYAGHLSVPGQLQWFSRGGVPQGAVGAPGEYLDFALSPDQGTLAFSRIDDPGLAAADLWLLDLARNVPTRFTSHPLNEGSALWSPDGRVIVFRSNRHGYTKLFRKEASGTGSEEVILDTGDSLIPTDWSRDGRWIVFVKTTAFDLKAWQLEGKAPPIEVANTALNAMHGRISPDGTWLAYASDESGELQVWVQPFPPTGEKRQLSPAGGTEPRWRSDGRELYYLSPDRKLMNVPIPEGGPFNAPAPAPLFEVRVPLFGNPYRENYAVTRDGQRFLINTHVAARPPSINVIVNWTKHLARMTASRQATGR